MIIDSYLLLRVPSDQFSFPCFKPNSASMHSVGPINPVSNQRPINTSIDNLILIDEGTCSSRIRLISIKKEHATANLSIKRLSYT